MGTLIAFLIILGIIFLMVIINNFMGGPMDN